jgi:hypothetical protein
MFSSDGSSDSRLTELGAICYQSNTATAAVCVVPFGHRLCDIRESVEDRSETVCVITNQSFGDSCFH